jgi:hypothetical protein
MRVQRRKRQQEEQNEGVAQGGKHFKFLQKGVKSGAGLAGAAAREKLRTAGVPTMQIFSNTLALGISRPALERLAERTAAGWKWT